MVMLDDLFSNIEDQCREAVSFDASLVSLKDCLKSLSRLHEKHLIFRDWELQPLIGLLTRITNWMETNLNNLMSGGFERKERSYEQTTKKKKTKKQPNS